MSLAKRNEREYLDIAGSEGGFSITAKPEHAEQLSALLTRHGYAHRRSKELASGLEQLLFAEISLRPKVAEVLESYKNVRGS